MQSGHTLKRLHQRWIKHIQFQPIGSILLKKTVPTIENQQGIETSQDLKDNVYHKIPHLQQMRTDIDAFKTSCTSTDLHNSTVQSTELGYEIQKKSTHNMNQQGKTQVAFQNRHREAASRSSHRIKIPLKIAPRRRTHNLEMDLSKQTRRQHLNKFNISSAATDETTCNKNSVETQQLHKLRDCLQFTAQGAPIPNSHIHSTSTAKLVLTILPQTHRPCHSLRSSNRHLQLSFTKNHPGNPARSGKSRPNAPAQHPIDTLPTVHHSESWTLHPKQHWTCSGPQDPHSHHYPTTQLGTHTWLGESAKNCNRKAEGQSHISDDLNTDE